MTAWGTVSPATQVQVEVTETPAAPAVGTPIWDPDSFGFLLSWTAPNDFTSLRAMRNFDNPASCPTTYDEDEAEWLNQDFSTGKWQLSAYHAKQCVSLFAVTSWGAVSARTEINPQVPVPTVTPVVGTIAPWASDPSAASATVSLADSFSYRLGIEVVPGACPAQPPADAEWWDGNEDWNAPGRWYWYPEPWGDTGPQCAMFAAVDGFGQHGPVVNKSFTVAPQPR